MRIGGLASGMDIDKIVGDLMKAERMPLDKMEREKTSLTWKRDAYREVNTQLFELENMAFDMNLEKSYNSKKTSSSDASAVTATATSDAGNGAYKVQVTQLASAAYKASSGAISGSEKIDADDKLSSQSFGNTFSEGTFTIKTKNEEGEMSHSFDVTGDKSLNDILQEINDSGIGVRAFYESTSDKVMIERTEEGNYNAGGEEIVFEGANKAFLTDTLKLDTEQGGDDAKFTYNDSLDITSHNNEYTLNGVNFKFHDTTANNTTINVTNDVDSAVEKITKFVDQYNKVIEDLNTRVSERKNREYQPLTQKQKESMDEKQIEMWEEQAKKGLLQSDSTIRNALSEMRNEWYESVDTSGKFSHLSEIGIETSSNYRDGGKLIIDEDKLRQKLTEEPDSVSKLFVGNGETEGIADKLKNTLNDTVKSVERKAGKASSVPNTYTLGREIADVNSEMDAFQDRLNQIEDRYWSQFTQMEKAIQKMNSQSAQLMQQMG